MKQILVFVAMVIVTSGCVLAETPPPSTQPLITLTQRFTPSQTMTLTKTATPTSTATVTPSITPTITPRPTKTPYPWPGGVYTRSELQQQMDNWISGITPFTDQDRMLDEKTGVPLRLGMLGKQVFEEVLFMYYNIGFTIVEDEKGIPFLLNLVGFEDGEGKRFAFPFHNGKLFSTKKSLILGEYYGKRIGRGKIIFQDFFTPLQYVEKGAQFLDLVNIGTTVIGTEGKDVERDGYTEAAKQTMQDLDQFLRCGQCSIKEIPKSLEIYINHIPDRFEVTIPFLWVIQVCY